LGLYAFLFATAHLTIFAWVDFGLDWLLIGREIIEKNYILIGMAALSILLILAITSFNLEEAPGQELEAPAPPGLAGACDPALRLGQERRSVQLRIFQPLAFGIIVALLLILRIPAVRRWSSGLRGRWLNFARS
jgi:DMSO/TMAO reductase YedYZ heme-binding membrane subunit